MQLTGRGGAWGKKFIGRQKKCDWWLLPRAAGVVRTGRRIVGEEEKGLGRGGGKCCGTLKGWVKGEGGGGMVKKATGTD